MSCTNAHSCILVSYHPETKSGNFFLICQSNLLLTVIKDICNVVLEGTVNAEWYYYETPELRKVGKNA